MTPTEQDLAQRLAEHPRWRWMAGMRVCSPDGWARVDDERLEQWEGWPNLADPATQGCIISMLDVLSMHHRSASQGGERWRLIFGVDGCAWSRTGATLGEALARALLALWGSTDA